MSKKLFQKKSGRGSTFPVFRASYRQNSLKGGVGMNEKMFRRKKRRSMMIKRGLFAGVAALLCVFGAVAVAAVLNGDKLPAVEAPSSAAGETTTPADLTTVGTEPPSTAPTAGSAGPSVTTPSAPYGKTVVKASDPVTDDYFADALFIGDSRTEGLSLYSGLDTAAFYTHKGLMVDTVFTKPVVKMGDETVTIMEALETQKFNKIYIMLGVNELGWAYESVFIQQYGKVIDELKRLEPGARIYVQSILPVTAKKSSDGGVYTNERIRLYNDLIVKMCEEKEVYYLNVAEAVQDASGVLPEEAAMDGIHLKPSYCVKWLDYLKSHTVA